MWRYVTGILTVTALTTANSPLTFGQANKPEAGPSPVLIEEWEQVGLNPGGFLLTMINLRDVEEICNKTLNRVNITYSVLESMKKAKIREAKSNQLSIIFYLLNKLETNLFLEIEYLGKVQFCNQHQYRLIVEGMRTLKTDLDSVWMLLTQNRNSVLATQLWRSRPGLLEEKQFPSAILGIGAGLIVGGLLGNWISGTLENSRLETINDNINKVNKKIVITNKRIDLLDKSLSESILKIKVILQEIEKQNSVTEVIDHIRWNLEVLNRESTDNQLQLRMSETRVTLLRKNIINPEMINLDSMRKVVDEGKLIFKNLEFPVEKIVKENIVKIVNLLRVEEVSLNKFAVVIPLVEKTPFMINSLIPIPIRLENNEFIITELEQLLLWRNGEYITTSKKELIKIDDKNYVIKEIKPIWSETVKSCELLAFTGRQDEIIKNCNHKRIPKEKELFTVETGKNRLIYSMQKRRISLICPDGRIRETLDGLYTTPLECDIESNTMIWRAKQEETVNIKDLLVLTPKKYDIEEIPIFKFNSSKESIHPTIKELIDGLHKENESFTFTFDDFDLNKIEPVSIIGYGVLSAIVVIDTIILIILVIFTWKGKREEDEEGWRRRIRNKWKDTFDSRGDSWRNFRRSIRGSMRRNREKVLERIGRKTNSKEVGTNTSFEPHKVYVKRVRQ